MTDHFFRHIPVGTIYTVRHLPNYTNLVTSITASIADKNLENIVGMCAFTLHVRYCCKLLQRI